MTKATKITVMISSRNNSKFKGAKLIEIRESLKETIEKIAIYDKQLFEVWINEKQFPSSLEENVLSWSIQAVREADIVIVLFNGEAGYVDEQKKQTMGICHSELIEAVNTARGTTWGIELEDNNKAKSNTVKKEDFEFQKYYKKQSICSQPVDNIKDLNKRVLEVIKDAVVTLMKKGVTESIRSKGNSGQALDWKRLNYPKRETEIIKAISSGFTKNGENYFLDVNGKNIFVQIGSIPDLLSIAKAREYVGQPFLYEHKKADVLSDSSKIGIVHIIGCHKTVSENQARNILGFQDAMILKDSFGVYVADDTNKIQMVFIEKCLDESSTKSQLQLFISWLNSTNERDEFIRRAESRKKIITIINKEMDNG